MATTFGLIDISRRRLRVSLLQKDLLRREERPLGDDFEGLDELLDELSGQGMLEADRWMLSLAGEFVSLHRLTLPLRDVRKASKALAFELETDLPFSMDELVIAHELRRSEEGTDAYCLVAPLPELERILGALQVHGVDPHHIVPEPLGPLVTRDRSERTLLIDVGATSSDIVAVEDGKLALLGAVDEAGDSVNRALRNSDQLDDQESERAKRLEARTEAGQTRLAPATNGLAMHISRALRSTMRELNWRSPALVLTGGGACLPGLKEAIEREVGLPIELGGETDELAEDQLTALATASELGYLRGLRIGKVWAPFNLRTGALAYQGDAMKVLRRLSGVASWGLILMFLMAAQLVANISVRSERAERFERGRQEACDQLVGLSSSTSVHCIAAMQEAIEGKGEGDIPTFDAVEVLAGISGAVPDDLEVKLDDIRIDERDLRLTGSTAGFHEASQLADALKKAPCVAELRSDKTVKQSDRVRFTFSGHVDCSKNQGEEGAAALSGTSTPAAAAKRSGGAPLKKSVGGNKFKTQKRPSSGAGRKASSSNFRGPAKAFGIAAPLPDDPEEGDEDNEDDEDEEEREDDDPRSSSLGAIKPGIKLQPRIGSSMKLPHLDSTTSRTSARVKIMPDAGPHEEEEE